jgi:hypothetical protein
LLPVIIVAVTAQATLSLVAATLPKSGQIYRRTLRLLPLLLAVELIRLITLGVLGLFAVGVFLFVAWSLVPFVLIAEGGRFLDSFSRSIELIRESWWRVTGLLSLVFVMSVYPTYEITSLTTPLGDLAPGFWWLGVVLSELVLIPLSAFGAAFGTLIYVDLRCRKEGLAWRLDSARRGPEREPFGPHGVYAQLPWQPTARR